MLYCQQVTLYQMLWSFSYVDMNHKAVLPADGWVWRLC